MIDKQFYLTLLIGVPLLIALGALWVGVLKFMLKTLGSTNPRYTYWKDAVAVAVAGAVCLGVVFLLGWWAPLKGVL